MRKKLLTPHFSSPDIETRWYSFSKDISLSLMPSSTLSTLVTLINLKGYREKGSFKEVKGRQRQDG